MGQGTRFGVWNFEHRIHGVRKHWTQIGYLHRGASLTVSRGSSQSHKMVTLLMLYLPVRSERRSTASCLISCTSKSGSQKHQCEGRHLCLREQQRDWASSDGRGQPEKSVWGSCLVEAWVWWIPLQERDSGGEGSSRRDISQEEESLWREDLQL